jgi:serine/threonine protein kinase
MLGQRLDRRYEITQKLGEGQFGETYLAIDHKRPSHPRCVVKRLKPTYTHPKILEFFDREAIILEKLGEHPQIPRLLAHFMFNPEFYIVQDFVEGHTLRSEINPGKRLSESYARKLLKDLLEILVFVHQQNVIHRDIKPENVMRGPDGRLVLIDFGAVKESGSVSLTAQGQVTSNVIIGTPGYIAPEQVIGKPRLNSDLYAVGVMTIEALTGIAPFDLEEDPRSREVTWRQFSTISDDLAQFLEKMVRGHSASRYRSASEALEDLHKLVLPTSSLPNGMPASSRPHAQTPIIRSPSAPTSASIPVPVKASPPSPPTSVPAPVAAAPVKPLINRKVFLKWIRLGIGGLLLAVVGRSFWAQRRPTQVPTAPESQPFPVNPASSPSAQTPQPLPISSDLDLKRFSFEVVTIDPQGQEIQRQSQQAEAFTEDLGNGVTLEMMAIPAGTFVMGSPTGERERGGNHQLVSAPEVNNEIPQHSVKVAAFFLGRQSWLEEK